MGGKPNKGTKADMRLKRNRSSGKRSTAKPSSTVPAAFTRRRKSGS